MKQTDVKNSLIFKQLSLGGSFLLNTSITTDFYPDPSCIELANTPIVKAGKVLFSLGIDPSHPHSMRFLTHTVTEGKKKKKKNQLARNTNNP